jgi:hypothetical protein
MDMFAEPIYVKAYQRGVLLAAEVFCNVWSSGGSPAREWPYPKSDAIAFVKDLASPSEDRLLRRLATLAHAGARNEWRHLSDASLRRSGVFSRTDAPVRDLRRVGDE